MSSTRVIVPPRSVTRVGRVDGSSVLLGNQLYGRGAPGPSNYELARANGFQGTEAAWLASLRVSAGGYEFTQELPAAVWTVPHNLNSKPVVVVVDHLGRQVMADVDYLDNNTVQVTHAIALTGAVYCK